MVTYQRVDTEMFADTVEWCPFEEYGTTLLCGTYQLQDDTPQVSSAETSNAASQVRLGHLRMYELQLSSTKSHQLQLKHKLPMPGILDIKWCKRKLDELMIFGLVNSVGELQIWNYISAHQEMCLLHKLKLGESCLGLSLDWSSANEGSNQRVIASDSTGLLSLYNVSSTEVHRLQRWKAHDFETWICAFNHWDENIIYSGGDDCKLKCWDSRTGVDSATFSKRFGMGVCSMQCNSVNNNVIGTGGYDEYLRLWDVRNWKSSTSDTKLDGGIWRIKWDTINGTHILTATMYNAFHIVNVSTPGDNLPIVLHYKDGEHGSLGYGADWCYLKTNSSPSTNLKSTLISTCSFYDHSLHLWSQE